MDTKRVKRPTPGVQRKRLGAYLCSPSLAFALVGAVFSPLIPKAATLDGLPGTTWSPSAHPLGRMGFNVSLGAFGHADARMIERRTFLYDTAGTGGAPDTALIQDLQTGSLYLNAAMGLSRFFELGLSVPYHMDLTADTDAKQVSGNGLGDPTFLAKLSIPSSENHIFDMGLLSTFTLPSKSPGGFLPKHTGYLAGDSVNAVGPRFLSTYESGFSLRALMTLDLTRTEAQIPFRANLNGGVRNPGLGGNRNVLGGSLEWIPIPFLAFFADAQTETRTAKFGKQFGKDLAQVTGGFWATSDDGMFFSAGVQRRLSKASYQAFAKPVEKHIYTYRAAAAPEMALALTIGWTGALVAQDLDKDGVPDNQDPCPNEEEDKDGFQDFDGCPERDNDEDGIGDVADKCPIEPEDKDGTEDGDGCPDHDNDGDNIPDALDKCPAEFEDLDNFEDYDGCPELDNDQDGVSDSQDKCPTQVEDKDGYEDGDGCADLDNDQDRIPDTMDKCPLEPETQNGFEDTDGCADLSRSGKGPGLEQTQHLKGVKFRAQTTELLASAYPALDSLAERLKGNPGAIVEIRAYMDKSDSELEEFRVTEAWAGAVRKHLLILGVPAQQMLARGMGSRDPIAPNTTAANRTRNRRIEVHRLN